MTKIKKDQIIVYQAKNGAIELRADADKNTLWATQKQLAEVFKVDVRTINEHIQNIFKTKELAEKSVIRNFRITASDGKSYNTKHYNLDMIVSVGYRVNSKTATKFRQWATKILRSYITEGYAINPSRIKYNYNKFLQAVEGVKKLLPADSKVGASDVLELVKLFANTWFSLDAYDKSELPKTGARKKQVEFTAEELDSALSELKKVLIKNKEATNLFAQERKSDNLKGIVGNVFQSVFGKDAYLTLEEKAAHLIYFIVKNHPFTDGNKRSGAFAFIWFLRKAGLLDVTRISPEALTTITLMIAESKPTDKDKMIGLVLLFLQKK